MTTTYRDQIKPDPNPGYQRSPTTVHRDRNGREVIVRDGMLLKELYEDYKRAGVSWPGEGKPR